MSSKQYAPEISALLNPGFLSLNIASAVAGYERIKESAMPWPLIYPAIALSLHTNTREILPRTIKTKFLTWVEDNQEIRVGFARRVNSLRPLVNHGLTAANYLGYIEFTGGAIKGSKSIPNKYITPSHKESAQCIRASNRVGSLFAGVSEAHLVFIVLGIRM